MSTHPAPDAQIKSESSAKSILDSFICVHSQLPDAQRRHPFISVPTEERAQAGACLLATDGASEVRQWRGGVKTICNNSNKVDFFLPRPFITAILLVL